MLLSVMLVLLHSRIRKELQENKNTGQCRYAPGQRQLQLWIYQPRQAVAAQNNKEFVNSYKDHRTQASFVVSVQPAMLETQNEAQGTIQHFTRTFQGLNQMRTGIRPPTSVRVWPARWFQGNVFSSQPVGSTELGVFSAASLVSLRAHSTHLTKSGALEMTCSNSANERELSSSRSASSKICRKRTRF